MSKQKQYRPAFKAKVASGAFKRGPKRLPQFDEEQVRDLYIKIRGVGRRQRFFGQKVQALDRQLRRRMIEAIPGLMCKVDRLKMNETQPDQQMQKAA